MDTFALDKEENRSEVFTETARRMGVAPIVIEKDFWVCWTLKRLFSLSTAIPDLIFKGGTSLSKGYSVIERFSEDIDISLDRAGFGFTGERDPANDKLGNKKRRYLLVELHDAAAEIVGGDLLTELTDSFVAALGGAEFDLSIDETDKQTLNFTYPPSLVADRYGGDYIKSVVRLEFGARSDHLPAEIREITPYICAEFPGLLAGPSVSIKTLGAERTFWEKATILHMLFHRDPDKKLGDRMSRHYSDMARLIESNVKDKAVADLSLLDAVALHKTIFFRSGWAKYEEAKPGSLRLSPSPQLEQALRVDYQKMSEMFFSNPPSFDDVLAAIASLEAEINAFTP